MNISPISFKGLIKIGGGYAINTDNITSFERDGGALKLYTSDGNKYRILRDYDTFTSEFLEANRTKDKVVEFWCI